MPETFAQALARTNPNGVSFGAPASGTVLDSTPSNIAGTTTFAGGSTTPTGTIQWPAPSGGNTLGASTVKAPVDPYAGTPFGSTAGFNQATTDYNNLKNTTFGSVDRAITGGAAGFNSSILDYLDQEKQQQHGIDAQSVQNELAREQGNQGVLDMVGNGVKSSGVVLANANSGSSSAGDALAKAYGTLGRQQMSKVGNQFAQGQNAVNTSQINLNDANTQQARHTDEAKTNTINTIVNNATTELTRLNQAAAYASLPDRIQIDQKIAEIKQQALDALSQYDGTLSQGIAANAPQNSDQIRANANQLLTAGTAPEKSFDYTTNIPAQFQNTGDFASSLPIFTVPKKQTV